MAQRPAYRFSLVLAYLLAVASVAGAQNAKPGAGRAAALHWVRLPGAEDCSGGDALSRSVEAKLRREVFPAPRNASVLIEGHVERSAGGYRAQLQMRSTGGELLGSRELSSEDSDCDELSETIAVVLAVMIDPDAAAPVASRDASGVQTEPAAESKKTSGKRADRYAQRLSGFARIAFGVQPTTAYGVGLVYELALAAWGGVRVEGVAFLPTKKDVAPEREVISQLLYAGLGYCPVWLTTGRLRSAGCAGFEAGMIQSWGLGFTGGENSYSDTWLSASLSAHLALRVVGALEAQLAGGVLFPTQRYQYKDRASEQAIFAIDAVAATIDLGLGARF